MKARQATHCADRMAAVLDTPTKTQMDIRVLYHPAKDPIKGLNSAEKSNREEGGLHEEGSR